MDVDGGEEAPPSLRKRTDSSWFFGTNELTHYQDNLEIIQHPVKNGVVQNWEAMEKLLDFIISENLHIDPKGHPLLFSESTVAPKDQREKLIEFAFEKFGTPAFFVAKEATLSAYASGRANALVVDVGADMAVVAPVHDGYVLQKSIQSSHFAGNKLTELVQNSVLTRLTDGLRPKYSFTKKKARTKWDITPIERPHVTQSFHQYQIWQVCNDIKEVACCVADSVHGNPPITPGTYELPDGSALHLDLDKHRIPESLFSAQSGSQSLRQMISSCIAASDLDLRRDLYSSIVITGGTTLLPGFPARIQKEIDAPPNTAKTIIPSDTSERRFSSWIGGSILGSLGTFHQMWISKSEYEETGKAIVHKRCP